MLNRLKILPMFFVLLLLVQNLRKTENGVHRCAQLPADAYQKFAFGSVGTGGLFRQDTNALGSGTKLTIGLLQLGFCGLLLRNVVSKNNLTGNFSLCILIRNPLGQHPSNAAGRPQCPSLPERGGIALAHLLSRLNSLFCIFGKQFIIVFADELLSGKAERLCRI